jgi:hypothetical protein
MPLQQIPEDPNLLRDVAIEFSRGKVVMHWH